MRWTALAAVGLMVTASCGGQQAADRRSPTPSSHPSPSSNPSPTALAQPGPLNLNSTDVATGLTAPWAIAFAKDGTIWLTERPGRVRVVRNGRLLPTPALTLSVASRPGCEGGLLGLALHEPYAYLFYTYASAGGNVNRVSRFTIQGDTLSAERVLLDGIPAGDCYHDGGRLKLGPDGYLYITTGETFNPSLAASATGLNGKILRVLTDGSGEEVFAWGFRNPQGIAFDPQGRLYASMNGPTGDLGLCCHDTIDLVQQGGFYGWPWYAANTRTSYSGGSEPPTRISPIVESGAGTVWAPSGITFFALPGQQATLLVTELSGQALRRLVIDATDPSRVDSQQIVFSGAGRLRDVVSGPDGCLYVVTSNRDGRGSPSAQDDRLVRMCAA